MPLSNSPTSGPVVDAGLAGRLLDGGLSAKGTFFVFAVFAVFPVAMVVLLTTLDRAQRGLPAGAEGSLRLAAAEPANAEPAKTK